jgi:hypothetical protein
VEAVLVREMSHRCTTHQGPRLDGGGEEVMRGQEGWLTQREAGGA